MIFDPVDFLFVRSMGARSGDIDPDAVWYLKDPSVEKPPGLKSVIYVETINRIALHTSSRFAAFARSILPVQCVRLSELTFIESLSEGASLALRWFREMGSFRCSQCGRCRRWAVCWCHCGTMESPPSLFYKQCRG